MQNDANAAVELNEVSVMEPFREGEREALRWIYNRLGSSILFFVMSIVRKKSAADDIVVKVFYLLFHARAGIQTYSDMQKWLYQAARDLCFDYLRKKWKNRIRSFFGWKAPITQYTKPAVVNKLENLQFILEEIEKVPGHRREWVREYILESEEVREMLRGLRINIR